MDERLKRQLEFALEIDKEKNIFRQTHLSGHGRRENDAEHAWHMAVMTILLSEYANEEINVLRAVSMLLIHDLVEIDAGDTYAYDAKGHEDKRTREVMAAKRIFALLPSDQEKRLWNLWEEFEEGKTAEARFAHAMDHIQPLMLNDAAAGRSWEEHGVHVDQVLHRNENTAEGSAELWEYAYNNFIKPNVEKGKLKE